MQVQDNYNEIVILTNTLFIYLLTDTRHAEEMSAAKAEVLSLYLSLRLCPSLHTHTLSLLSLS
jgi:hypothetical protein